MKKADQVNAVALSMQRVMGCISDLFNDLVGAGQHEIILLVGAGDVVQFCANTPRPRSVLMLQDLLARWSVGLPDTLPGETSAGDTRAFEYLLNDFEQASQSAEPHKHDYAAKRKELLTYVGELIAKGNRSGA